MMSNWLRRRMEGANDVKKAFRAYSSSSPLSSLGKACNSSSSSASCFLLRVDIVGLDDGREWVRQLGGVLW